MFLGAHSNPQSVALAYTSTHHIPPPPLTPQSPQVANRWRKLDLTFILVLNTCATYALSYFTFGLWPSLLWTLLVGCTAALGIQRVAALRPKQPLDRRRIVGTIGLTCLGYYVPLIIRGLAALLLQVWCCAARRRRVHCPCRCRCRCRRRPSATAVGAAAAATVSGLLPPLQQLQRFRCPAASTERSRVNEQTDRIHSVVGSLDGTIEQTDLRAGGGGQGGRGRTHTLLMLPSCHPPSCHPPSRLYPRPRLPLASNHLSPSGTRIGPKVVYFADRKSIFLSFRSPAPPRPIPRG